jgi:hypothetical protein
LYNVYIKIDISKEYLSIYDKCPPKIQKKLGKTKVILINSKLLLILKNFNKIYFYYKACRWKSNSSTSTTSRSSSKISKAKSTTSTTTTTTT